MIPRIDISDHPVLPDVKRKVYFERFDASAGPEFGMFIDLYLRVEFYKLVEDVEQVVNIKSGDPQYRIVRFRADNSSFVDAEGNLVPQEESVATEFQYFIQMLFNPVTIHDFVILKTLQEDAKGSDSRFN
jgi:hypothetical protein